MTKIIPFKLILIGLVVLVIFNQIPGSLETPLADEARNKRQVLNLDVLIELLEALRSLPDELLGICGGFDVIDDLENFINETPILGPAQFGKVVRLIGEATEVVVCTTSTATTKTSTTSKI